MEYGVQGGLEAKSAPCGVILRSECPGAKMSHEMDLVRSE